MAVYTNKTEVCDELCYEEGSERYVTHPVTQHTLKLGLAKDNWFAEPPEEASFTFG